jgi:hypothetical protein
VRLPIEHDWQGVLLPESDRALVTLSRGADELVVTFDAPYFGDAAPLTAAGSTPRLWEHEVVEVFIADSADHYLELEFGPHRHYLALELRGVRKIAREGMEVAYDVRIEPESVAESGASSSAPIGRYRGTGRVPMSYLPLGPARVNAYLIHGGPDSRCYHAHVPVPGERPDFHRLAHFARLEW